MNTSLFAQFAPSIQSFDGTVDTPSLRLAALGSLEVYYAPFDAINPQARVLLLGVTPGRVQATNALVEAQRQLRQGSSHETALLNAKRTGAFSGAMRNNLVSMLDHVQLHRWLQLPTTAHLFGPGADLLQSASILPFPVFFNGQNYNGTPDPLGNELLKKQMLEHFVPMLLGAPLAVVVPLGPVPTRAMNWLVDEGFVKPGRVLQGLPHPSGANGERIQYFLGNKLASALSAKTDPIKLDAARAALQRAVAALP